ncbi:TetR/AcrR family transcriptional regulator [Limosilactobacillus kribbianus]|uniref:TetR/AcrR family transcriptional regulator n=1 Tax=Limosilactobacillus kribbianus TaxID=2982695 RepID=UPI002264D9FB|nr:TetR-like C-terminal domain-containing protein [Limosilactobacillus kribbianus]
MDKRKKQVKERLLQALRTITTNKSLGHVTVTDLVTESGVARASFYRNFKGIADLIDYGVNQLREEYWKNAPQNKGSFVEPAMLEYTFSFYYQNRNLILSFHHAGTSTTVLEIITESMALSYGTMPANSILRYRLYYYAGALDNMMIHWLESGAKESPHEMALAFLQFANFTPESETK